MPLNNNDEVKIPINGYMIKLINCTKCSIKWHITSCGTDYNAVAI